MKYFSFLFESVFHKFLNCIPKNILKAFNFVTKTPLIANMMLRRNF